MLEQSPQIKRQFSSSLAIKSIVPRKFQMGTNFIIVLLGAFLLSFTLSWTINLVEDFSKPNINIFNKITHSSSSEMNEMTSSIKNNQFDKFQQLLRKNPELIHQNTNYGVTPLVLAFSYGRLEMFKILFALQPDPNLSVTNCYYSFYSEHCLGNNGYETNLLNSNLFYMRDTKGNPIYDSENHRLTQQYLISQGATIDELFLINHLNSQWMPFFIDYYHQRGELDYLKKILVNRTFFSERDLYNSYKTIFSSQLHSVRK